MDQLALLVACLGHIALWVEIVNRTHGVGWSKGIVDAWTITCGLGLVVAPLYAWSEGVVGLSSAPAPLFWYGLVCYAVLIVVVLGRLGVGGHSRVDRYVRRERTEQIDLREQLGDRATGSSTLSRVANLPGNQLLVPHFEHRTHATDRLPEGLAGLKIAHLTDLHMSGRIGMSYFQELVQLVNAWSPDLVCVTGDVVEYPAQLDWIEPTLGGLRSRLGAYYILGNHDRYAGATEVRARLTAAGLIDVGGRAHRLSDAPLTLCGDERPWFSGEPSLNGDESFVLCLAHTPDRLTWAAKQGVDLMLAGHCHGGQVCFPLLGPLLCPSQHGARYASGSFRRAGTAMHVSRGAGSLFPIRFMCPPEVGLITLSERKLP